MNKELPNVSIAVPCRNEEKHILKFLEGLLLQDYPQENLEIIIADGMSTDNTRKIISDFSSRHPELNIKIIDNEKRVTPAAYNVGVKNATGEYIMTSGAHSKMSSNYISGCVAYLVDNQDVDCVGGSVITVPGVSTSVAKAIALSLSHPFGTGNATFRNSPQKPMIVDTVYHGCYRREVFEKIGYYNEKLLRSQDLDLNLRLINAGGKIVINPSLKLSYHPKDSFREILKYHFNCGLWVPRAQRLTSTKYKLRHFFPLIVFMLALLLLVGSFFSAMALAIFLSLIMLYIFMSLYFSTKLAIRERDAKLVILLPIAFFLRHFGFGLGSFVGLIY